MGEAVEIVKLLILQRQISICLALGISKFHQVIATI